MQNAEFLTGSFGVGFHYVRRQCSESSGSNLGNNYREVPDRLCHSSAPI